jgi:hypothetical protein
MIEDEIVDIEYIGEQETIDINVSGNRLFYANGILTHNSAVEEIEFDHSHISGGISKINTADNVFGIFTSRAMRERGRYQIQCMKSRSSTGVGQKIELDYNVETMRITDSGGEDSQQRTQGPPKTSIMDQIKPKTTVVDHDTGEVTDTAKVNAEAQSTKLKRLLSGLRTQSE